MIVHNIRRSVPSGGVAIKSKHVLRVRDARGEEIERVVFRGFPDSELDAAIDAFILAHAAGDTESPLWEKLLREIEGTG